MYIKKRFVSISGKSFFPFLFYYFLFSVLNFVVGFTCLTGRSIDSVEDLGIAHVM